MRFINTTSIPNPFFQGEREQVSSFLQDSLTLFTWLSPSPWERACPELVSGDLGRACLVYPDLSEQ